MRPIRLDRLTSLRFIAAMTVIVTHGSLLMIQHLTYFKIVERGAASLSFFFILSGFVLTWSHDEHDTSRSFWQRRFARVYPMHFVCWAIAIFIIYVIYNRHQSPGTTVSTLFLLQAWDTHSGVYFGSDGVSWSLSNELFFYALFPLIVRWLLGISLQTRWRVAAACVLIPCLIPIAASFLSSENAYWLVFVCPLSRLPEFVLGMVLALQFRDGWQPAIPMPVAIGIGAVGVALAYVLPSPWWHVCPTVLPLAIVIVLAVQRDVGGKPSWLTNRRLVTLGNWSFATYLLHALVLYLIGRWWGPFGIPSGIAVSVLLAALSIGLAGVFHTYLEAPAERRLRGAPPRREALGS